VLTSVKRTEISALPERDRLQEDKFVTNKLHLTG
jgi:hypothetical protein